jgi:hypothetical protein
MATCYVLDSSESNPAESKSFFFFIPVQTGHRDHSASCAVGTGTLGGGGKCVDPGAYPRGGGLLDSTPPISK